MSEDKPTGKNSNTNKMAFIVGYTGETGKALVKEISKTKLFRKVVLIGRREVKLDADVGPEIEQKIVDFDCISDYKESFKDLDTGFCCLGTTRGKAGKDGFIKVDHDYVVQSAEVAKSMGCKHFLLVSSYGAKKDSFFLYPRVKGEVEEELKAMNFERLSIFRPGMLLCEREESRPMEACIRCCFKPLPKFVIHASAVSTADLATAMLNKVVNPSTEKVETIENKQLYSLI